MLYILIRTFQFFNVIIIDLGSAVCAFFKMMASIESSVSLEKENSNSLTLTTISEAKKLDANLSKPENAAIARKPKRTKILIS